MSLCKKNLITIYTDGACKGNPGKGGWGAVLLWGDHEKHICGGALNTTNNRMEMLAAIEALKCLKMQSKVALYTDSNYLKNGVNIWMANWKQKSWKTSAGKAVKNQDLWMLLDELLLQYHVEWHWVKGHSGNQYNEVADDLANQGVLKV